MDALARLFTRSGHVSVVGAAGVGKTALVRTMLFERDAQAIFCDVGGAESADDVLVVLADALALETSRGALLARVGAALRERGGPIVVLDGFDRVEANAAAALCDALATDARLLTTSREAKRTSGATFPLGPLPLEPIDGVSPAELLFLRRAEEAIGRDLREDGAVPPSIRALVRALDGLPLALEVAASTLHVLAPEEFLARRALLLDVPCDGGSLRSALTISWAGLDPHERGALSALAIFAGDFDFDAARAVLGDDALVQLLRLTRASFLVSERTPRGQRYRMFSVVRDFVASFEAEEVWSQAVKRHDEHFGVCGLDWMLRGEMGERLEATEFTRREEHNLLAVVERSFAGPDEGVERASGALAALCRYWVGCGTARVALLYRFEALVRKRGLPPSLGITSILLMLAYVARQEGDFERADRFGAQALDAARAIEMPYAIARCHLERARLGHLRGDHVLVDASVDAARAVAQSLDLDALSALVTLSARLSSRPPTEGELTDAHERAKRVGDPMLVGRTALALGTHCFITGRPAEALAYVGPIEETCARLGQWTSRALAGLVEGNALAELGKRSEAREALEHARNLSRRIGHRRCEAEAIGNLALLDLEDGDRDGAIEGLSASIDLFARHDTTRRYFEAARAAVVAWSAPGTVPAYAAARDAAGEISGSFAIELENIAQMLKLDLDAPREARRRTVPTGAARVAQRVRASVHARLVRTVMVVDATGAWFQPPGGEKVSLAHRPLLRSLVRELVKRGAPSRDALVDALWPDEPGSSRRSMQNRLSVALSTLRGLGFRTAATPTGISVEGPVVIAAAPQATNRIDACA